MPPRTKFSLCSSINCYSAQKNFGNLIESKPPFLPTRLVTIAALLRRYLPSPHPLLRLLSYVYNLGDLFNTCSWCPLRTCSSCPVSLVLHYLKGIEESL